MIETDCPRTRALLEQIKGLGYSAANDRCTSLCWELERELQERSRLERIEPQPKCLCPAGPDYPQIGCPIHGRPAQRREGGQS